MRRTFLIGAVVLAFVAAGCGGSKSTSSQTSVQWANDVCSATTTWKNQLSKLAGSVRASGLNEASLKTAVSSVQAATATYAKTLKSLGPPKTNAGAQAKQSIDTLAEQLSKGADAIKQALDSSSLPAAITTMSTTFSSMETNMKSALSSLQSLDAKGELKQAFKSAEKCAPYTGS